MCACSTQMMNFWQTPTNQVRLYGQKRPVPNFTLNNQICECTSTVVPIGTSTSAGWCYSPDCKILFSLAHRYK
jgi:hypothetical protein